MRFRREQYLELMSFGQPDRQMFVELFGPLVGLEDEWRIQGAAQEEIDLVAFDWDYVPVVLCGGSTGLFGGDTITLEDSDEVLVQRDPLGRTLKLFKRSATIPLPLNHPVHNMDTWRAVKPLFTFRPDRIDREALARAKRAQNDGALVVANIPGGFDIPRDLMGEETTCLAYYEQPELMHDIIATLRDTSLQVLERITDKIVVDQLSVHEDLAGKAGPLIGPAQITGFVAPYYKSVWELVSSRGTKIFDMDSDGNLERVLDLFLGCGLNSMHPMEPAAGMDIVALRARYGTRLAMRGGINKHVLRESKDAIRVELEYKLQPSMQQGGIAFGLDHRIPNGTPIDLYRYYVDLGRELLNLPPRSPQSRGWQRMAF